MHKRAKELIKQLAAELEFETIPALKQNGCLYYGTPLSDTAEAIRKDLTILYKRLSERE